MVVGSGVEAERGAGVEKRKGADWDYEEEVEGLVPDGQEPSNAFGNY